VAKKEQPVPKFRSSAKPSKELRSNHRHGPQEQTSRGRLAPSTCYIAGELDVFSSSRRLSRPLGVNFQFLLAAPLPSAKTSFGHPSETLHFTTSSALVPLIGIGATLVPLIAHARVPPFKNSVIDSNVDRVGPMRSVSRMRIGKSGGGIVTTPHLLQLAQIISTCRTRSAAEARHPFARASIAKSRLE